MNIKRKIVEKETFTTEAGSKIEYDSDVECNGEKKRCCKKIPAGKFRHQGKDHRCYSGDAKDNIQSHHVVRPIPQTQIDRTVGGYPQNPGYPQ